MKLIGLGNMVIICKLPGKTFQYSCQVVKDETAQLFKTKKNGPNIVPTQKSQKRFADRLRALRWPIYHEEKKSMVKKLLDKYRALVGEFLVKFKMRLKPLSYMFGTILYRLLSGYET